MSPAPWISQSPLFLSAWQLHEDAGGDMVNQEKIATLLKNKGAREDLISSALLHNISLRGEIFLLSVDHLFGSGIAAPVIAASPDNLSEFYPNQQERLKAADWRARALLVSDLLVNKPDDYKQKIKTISPYNRNPVLAALTGTKG